MLGLVFAVVLSVYYRFWHQRILILPFKNFWVKDHRQIYLIGNPMVWYLSTAAIVFYIAVRGFLVLRAKRGFRDFENSKWTPPYCAW